MAEDTANQYTKLAKLVGLILLGEKATLPQIYPAKSGGARVLDDVDLTFIKRLAGEPGNAEYLESATAPGGIIASVLNEDVVREMYMKLRNGMRGPSIVQFALYCRTERGDSVLIAQTMEGDWCVVAAWDKSQCQMAIFRNGS